MLHTITALVLAGLVPVAQSQAAPEQLSLEIGLSLYRGDGTRSGYAGTDVDALPRSDVDALPRYVWSSQASLCGISAGSGRAPRETPFVGWRLSGRILQRLGDAVVVTAEWQRLWDNQTVLANGPKGEQQLTLRAGDRVELDRVVPADGHCTA